MLAHNLLLPIQKLYEMRHPWIAQDVAGVKHYAAIVDDWCRAMVNFKNMAIDGLSWGVGGPASTSTRREETLSGSRSMLYAGGAVADTRKVESKRAPDYGRSG